jgi:hypothetical protein
MNITAINERLPIIIPALAKSRKREVDRVVDVFGLMGGKELANYQFFCDRQSCDQWGLEELVYMVHHSNKFYGMPICMGGGIMRRKDERRGGFGGEATFEASGLIKLRRKCIDRARKCSRLAPQLQVGLGRIAMRMIL